MTPEALAILKQHLLDGLQNTPDETRRLFHGRGRVWPGLEQITADWMQGVLLVSLFREPAQPELEALNRLLLELTRTPQWQASGAHTLLLQHRYLPESTTEWLLGQRMEEWQISESGLHFKVDLGRKQNCGLFLDMRYGRDWIRAQAQGKRILNLFAYTCGFSVAAIAGGAEHVVNLDMSRAALTRGRENHRLNQHDLRKVSFLDHELFKSWGKVKKSGPYDLIISDPPSFQRGSFQLDKDYQKVLRRMPELLAPGGQVLACMNEPSLGSDFLIQHTAVEAPSLHFEQRLANPPEFPDAEVEGGLKALIFRNTATKTGD
jgi:23S rRNA (cytosine1962-C5)-methyltransferase